MPSKLPSNGTPSCGRHSKVIDSEPLRYTASVLAGFKASHEQPAEIELSQADGKKVDGLLAEYREINIVAQKVVFTKTKGPTIAPPPGSIGSDLLMRNYTKHLIDRYNDFASKQPNRKTFAFPAVHSLLKKRYGVGKWELVPIGRFDDLCYILQERIDATWLGSVNRSKGVKNYSSLAEYRAKYFAP